MINYSDRHIDVGLTNFSKRLDNQGFIWPLLLPRVKVKKDSDKYWIYGDEHFKVPYAKRRDKTESMEVEWSMSNTDYSCQPSAAHVKISKRDRNNADSPIRLEQDGTQLAREKVMLSIEKEVADMLVSTSNITTYSTLGAGGTNLGQWNDPTSAQNKPLEIIDTAVQSIYDYTLKEANTIVIPWKVWQALKLNADIKELLKYQYAKQIIEGQAVPMVINGLRVLIARAAYDATKKKVARTTFTNLWSDTVLVAYIDPKPGWGSDTLGVSFDSAGPVVRKWHDSNINCDKIEFEEQGLDHVLTDAYCGYLLVDTLK